MYQLPAVKVNSRGQAFPHHIYLANKLFLRKTEGVDKQGLAISEVDQVVLVTGLHQPTGLWQPTKLQAIRMQHNMFHIHHAP